MSTQTPSFSQRVVAWQRVHGRHGLPWQGTRDAYRIWLSEIMLQQTQVATVLRYYDAFLRRFPSVEELAAAPQDEVLAAWSGLGYYSRARNLHRCAQAVVLDHGGVFPTRAEVLETLPGIGRSTAAAVAAFSSGQRVAILDGNVKRVLTRVLGFEEDVARPQGQRRLWALAEELLPLADIEAYTQGLMDLGATVCLQRRPQCERCPVGDGCQAQAQKRPQDFPVKSRRTTRGQRHSILGIFLSLVDDKPGSPVQLLMWRRPAKGVWAGLWSLPEWAEEVGFKTFLEAVVGAAPKDLRVDSLPEVVHALTHLDLSLNPRRLWVDGAMRTAMQEQMRQALATAGLPTDVEWVSLDVALERGLPAPVRRLVESEAG